MSKLKIKIHERNSDNDPQRSYDKLNPAEKRHFDGLADTVEALVGMFDENGNLSKPQQDQLKEARDTIYVFGYAARGYVSLADEVLANYGVEPLLDPNEPVFDESKKNETFASPENIEKIENYLRPRMVGNTYGKNSLSPENDIQREINKLFRESGFHTLDGAIEDDLCFDVSFIHSEDIDDDDLPKGTNKAYFYDYATDAFVLFTIVVYVEEPETFDGVKVTGLYADTGD